MEPVVEFEGVRVFHGDCRDVLRELPDNSVDSVVTDPPYELGFMGKKWDSSGIAYDVTVWEECLRVLKPGGHLLAFGGSRTWHRLAVAIEDAGFEIRDNIAWLSNKTFPKSLNVSKAIDKGQGQNKERQLQFVRWMRDTGLKAREINKIIGKSDVGSHYLRFDQPAIATAELFDKLRPYLPEVPEYIERLVAERTGIEWKDYVKRQVVGMREVPKGHAFASEKYGKQTGTIKVEETASHNEEAKKWEGWGTSLKPCFEPVVMARKPLGGTVAESVTKWGTGAINIDASRLGAENRWPSNACIDESVKEELGEPAKFFYVSRATKADRDEGLENVNQHPTVKPTVLMQYLIKMVTQPGGVVLDPFTGSGSTGKAAVLDSFQFVGIELTPEYLPTIEARLRWAFEHREEQNDTLF